MKAELTPQQLIQKMRELIEKGFAQQVFACDHGGHSVNVEHPDATCWCTLGARDRAFFELTGTTNWFDDDGSLSVGLAVMKAVEAAIAEKPCCKGTTIATFNDSHTKEEVLAMLVRAEELIAWPS